MKLTSKQTPAPSKYCLFRYYKLTHCNNLQLRMIQYNKRNLEKAFIFHLVWQTKTQHCHDNTHHFPRSTVRLGFRSNHSNEATYNWQKSDEANVSNGRTHHRATEKLLYSCSPSTSISVPAAARLVIWILGVCTVRTWPVWEDSSSCQRCVFNRAWSIPWSWSTGAAVSVCAQQDTHTPKSITAQGAVL